jgi:superoxide dismutase
LQYRGLSKREGMKNGELYGKRLQQSRRDGRFQRNSPQEPLHFNQWINGHEVGHPAGCRPILVMDVFEHAFMTDYGLKRADYIAAFFNNIDWGVVEARLIK